MLPATHEVYSQNPYPMAKKNSAVERGEAGRRRRRERERARAVKRARVDALDEGELKGARVDADDERELKRARVGADDEGELKGARDDAGSSDGELFELPVVDDGPQEVRDAMAALEYAYWEIGKFLTVAKGDSSLRAVSARNFWTLVQLVEHAWDRKFFCS